MLKAQNTLAKKFWVLR